MVGDTGRPIGTHSPEASEPLEVTVQRRGPGWMVTSMFLIK